jgi:hypothetical protein
MNMKKTFLTLFLAFVTVCGFAQEKIWDNVVVGYRTSTVFDVNKVWFYPDRTDVLLHLDLSTGSSTATATCSMSIPTHATLMLLKTL